MSVNSMAEIKNSQKEPVNAEPAGEADKLFSENGEMKERLMRLQADFENYQKRAAKENAAQMQLGKARAFGELLEFLDSFDAALVHVKDEHRAGMEGLRTQLGKILSRNGITPIPTLGKPFDPARHECLMQDRDPMQKENVVLEEFQKGYFFNGDVLRPAKVKVNMLDREEGEEVEEKVKNEDNRSEKGNPSDQKNNSTGGKQI